MIRIADIMARMPELARAYALMADPDRSPTDQELADASAALARDRAARQGSLSIRTPSLAGSSGQDSADAEVLGAAVTLRPADRVSADCEGTSDA